MVTKLFVSPGELGAIIQCWNPAHSRCGKNPHELDSLRFRAEMGCPAIQRKEMANFGTGILGIFHYPLSFGEGQGRGRIATDHLPSLRSVRQKSAPHSRFQWVMITSMNRSRLWRDFENTLCFLERGWGLGYTQYSINHCKYLKITVSRLRNAYAFLRDFDQTSFALNI